MSECWDDLAVSNREAAVMLRQKKAFRSAISRAYYAVYALVTARLCETGLNFAHEWEGPAHQSVPELVKNHLKRLSRNQRSKVAEAIKILYSVRIQADYWPSASVGVAEARESLQYAGIVFGCLRGRQ